MLQNGIICIFWTILSLCHFLLLFVPLLLPLFWPFCNTWTGGVWTRSRFVVQVFNHYTLEREVRDSYEQDMFTFCIAAHTKRDYKRDYSQDKKKKQFNGAYLSTWLSRSFATATKNRTRQLQTITSSKGPHSISVWCEKSASSILVLHNNPSELTN